MARTPDESRALALLLNQDSTYLQEARTILDWERLPQDCQEKAEAVFLKIWGRPIEHTVQ
jgi:hypothetical protein